MKNKTKFSVDGLFALLLLLVYIITVLFVILSGIGVYKKTLKLENEHFNSSTAIMYVKQKVRSADSVNAIKEENFKGKRCLVINFNENEKTYKNYIFYDKGYLCELYASDNSNLEDVFPTKIVPVSSFNFELDGNLLKLYASDDSGKENKISLNLYGGD